MEDYLKEFNSLKDKLQDFLTQFKSMIDDVNDLIDKLEYKKKICNIPMKLNDLDGVLKTLNDYKYLLFSDYLQVYDIALEFDKNPPKSSFSIMVWKQCIPLIEEIRDTNTRKIESVKILAHIGFGV